MSVFWTNSAFESFEEESAFILRKWNTTELEKFYDLIDENIILLNAGILLGTYFKSWQVRKVKISKQTSLFYRHHKSKNQIELLLFWNNQKDPATLFKLLQEF